MDQPFIKVDPNDHILCVNITRTYQSGQREDIYDCARHYWRLKLSRAEQANLVLAIAHGIVVGVFHPIQWYPSTNRQYAGRYEFDGNEVKESPYYNKCVWNVISRKTQNPISYINL